MADSAVAVLETALLPARDRSPIARRTLVLMRIAERADGFLEGGLMTGTDPRVAISRTTPATVSPRAAFPRAHSRVRAFTLLLATAALLCGGLLGGTQASAISRTTAIARAQYWVDRPVPYSQSRYHRGYRTDCSGFVSMCWNTGTSWSTRSFHVVTHRIRSSELTPGDAMLNKGHHIRLFYDWLDEAHTQYVAYESGTKVSVCRIHSLAEDLASGYKPVRYDRIRGVVTSPSLLRNGKFDSWTRSWGPANEEPVWWKLEGSWWQTLAQHSRRTFHTARNSIKLLNPGDPETRTELSQTASVTAGVPYRFSAWAKSANAEQLEFALTYLDPFGEPIAETTRGASQDGIGSAQFGRVSVVETAPPDAVRARVSVHLAAASVEMTYGIEPTSTAAFVDDLTLRVR